MEETIELLVKVRINYDTKSRRNEAIKKAKRCALSSRILGSVGCDSKSAKLYNGALKNKTEASQQIKKRISEILADERISYKTASTFSNAPLALIQWGLETELHTLQKISGVPLTNIKELRKEK